MGNGERNPPKTLRYHLSRYAQLFMAPSIEHGWLYVPEGSVDEGMFIFDLGIGNWIFTSSVLYPTMYSFLHDGWVFYFEGSTGPRSFVNLQTEEFFFVD